MILKRAADLVEALYGMPHNNQVRNYTDKHFFTQTVHVMKIYYITISSINNVGKGGGELELKIYFDFRWSKMGLSQLHFCHEKAWSLDTTQES